MAYVTQTQVEKRMTSAEVIRTTDDAASGAVDVDVLAQAITSSEAEVLGYVAQRWTLPLVLTDAGTAELVRSKILDVVEYRLYSRRPPVMEEKIVAYDRAIKWAEAVAAGKIGLAGEVALGASPVPSGKITVEADTRIISHDSMSGL